MKIGPVDPEIICLKGLFKKNDGVYMFAYLKLQSYWTKVHLIYKHCNQLIIDEHSKIRMAILQSISECQGYK